MHRLMWASQHIFYRLEIEMGETPVVHGIWFVAARLPLSF